MSLLLAGLSFGAQERPEEKGPIRFGRDIRPILSENCFRCHGPDGRKRQADLRLDTKEGAFAELEPGRFAIVPGDPARSALWARISTTDVDERMPPPKSGKRLAPAEIELLRRWIEAGAPWEGPWAFVPLRREPASIDALVEARLREQGLRPSPEADRFTLIRRVALDLTGLPPTPAEVDAFVADPSPEAYETLVDRLLRSPRYGEHMARFWLDLARYGDTHGLHGDYYREMWLYRDWVIRAFNANLPFERFVTEQLAGDLLPGATLDAQIASGFNRCHVTTAEAGSIEEEVHCRNVFDRVETFAQVFLALTLGCARCHDHKYDPLTQKEYYQLFAFFNSMDGPETDANAKDPAPVVKVPGPEQDRELADLRDSAARVESRMNGPEPEAASGDWAEALAIELAGLRQREKALLDRVPTTLVYKERARPREAYVLKRGEYAHKGERVSRNTPAAIPPMDAGLPRDRRGLARWLFDPRHPLTARVAVNRLWQQCFGTGLVKTSEDFGAQGEPPSHPELLDHLAAAFIEDGWDVKRMLKRIVLSGTYRQGSRASPELARRDPENRLLARGPRFRLDAETLRDQALFVSGLLVERLGGPSVKPPQPEGLWEAVGYPGSNTYTFTPDEGPEKVFRRSVYTFWKRTAPPPPLASFNAPSRETCVARRERTNTPLQALVLMNETQYVEAARHLARRALKEAGPSAEARAAWLFRLAAARPPDARDVADLVETCRGHLAAYRAQPPAAGKLAGQAGPPFDPAELAAWTMVASLVLNLDEVLTKR